MLVCFSISNNLYKHLSAELFCDYHVVNQVPQTLERYLACADDTYVAIFIDCQRVVSENMVNVAFTSSLPAQCQSVLRSYNSLIA